MVFHVSSFILIVTNGNPTLKMMSFLHSVNVHVLSTFLPMEERRRNGIPTGMCTIIVAKVERAIVFLWLYIFHGLAHGDVFASIMHSCNPRRVIINNLKKQNLLWRGGRNEICHALYFMFD